MWLIDPITKQKSVALTLLMLATVLMVGGIVMECFTNLRSTHLLDELFGAAVTLYGGHIFAFRDCINGPYNSNPLPPTMPPRQDIQP